MPLGSTGLPVQTRGVGQAGRGLIKHMFAAEPRCLSGIRFTVN